MKTQREMRPRGGGFTLIELLIAVAIIAILATIALPNFLEAQTRSKVSRVRADMATLATALEAYAADNLSYPPVPILLEPRFRRLRPLTTPVAYMTSIPTDPFMGEDSAGFGRWRFGIYRYGGTPIDKPARWALASEGPDQQIDTQPLLFYPGYTPGLFAGEVAGFDYTLYDPTNGTISRGDIFRANDFMGE